MKDSKIFKKNIIIYVLLIFIFLAYLAIFYFVLKKRSICIIKAICHIPCPSCGVSRAYVSLFKGDIKASFYYHPLFWLYPVLGFICIFRNLKYINPIFKSKIFCISVLLLLLGVYIYRLIYVFPNDIFF